MKGFVLQNEKVMSKVHGCINICQIFSCSSLRAPYYQYCLPQNFQWVHSYKVSVPLWCAAEETEDTTESCFILSFSPAHSAIPYSSHACLADPKAVLLTSLHLGTFQPSQWKLASERINEACVNGSAVHIMEQCTGYSGKERQRM